MHGLYHDRTSGRRCERTLRRRLPDSSRGRAECSRALRSDEPGRRRLGGELQDVVRSSLGAWLIFRQIAWWQALSTLCTNSIPISYSRYGGMWRFQRNTIRTAKYSRARLEHPHYKQPLDIGVDAVACDGPVEPGPRPGGFREQSRSKCSSHLTPTDFADRVAPHAAAQTHNFTDGPVLWRSEGSKGMQRPPLALPGLELSPLVASKRCAHQVQRSERSGIR